MLGRKLVSSETTGNQRPYMVEVDDVEVEALSVAGVRMAKSINGEWNMFEDKHFHAHQVQATACGTWE